MSYGYETQQEALEAEGKSFGIAFCILVVALALGAATFILLGFINK